MGDHYTFGHTCPLCEGKGNIVDEDYAYAFRKSLDRLAMAEEKSANQFRFLAGMTKEIRDRLFGNFIGSVQENLTILELKSACPCDTFVEEMSAKHGTDILATIMENCEAIGKISISVKHHKKWNSNFITQLEKNILNDNSGWGLLVTTTFPKEALNENMWTTLDSNGRMLLMAKPQYAPAAYYAVRQILIYQHYLRQAIEVKRRSQKTLGSLPAEERHQIIGDQPLYVPVMTNKSKRS